MGIDFLTLDGVSTRDFGVMLIGPGTYNAPGRSYESVSVPGRNGNVLFDNGKYDNITVEYHAVIMGPTARLDAFRGWLLSHTDYCRIEDTYHPEEYRTGMPISGLVPSVAFMRNAAKFSIFFDCKPQRFLKSGEREIVLTSNSKIHNNTFYEARPLIYVTTADEHGVVSEDLNGVVGIGSDTFTLKRPSGDPRSLTPNIILDCDVEDAYLTRRSPLTAYNLNAWVTLSGNSYPTLPPGDTAITMSGNITEVVITPRWWTL